MSLLTEEETVMVAAVVGIMVDVEVTVEEEMAVMEAMEVEANQSMFQIQVVLWLFFT